MVKQRSRKKNSKSDIQSSQMSKTCVHHDHFDFMMINLMANDDDDDDDDDKPDDVFDV